MKIKKLFFSLVSVVCAFAIVFALAACNDKGGTIALAKPQLYLSGNLLYWSEVENADSYEVYENDAKIDTVTNTSYTITQTVPGTYTYAIKAISSDKTYSASPFSNERTYTVNAGATKLATPEISISTDAVISWQEVAHADGYDVYEDGVLLATTELTSYIIYSAPGLHAYTVTATSTDNAYTTSNPSDPIVFTVPLRVTIGIEFPANYPEKTLTVGLYSGQTKVAETEIDVELDSGSYGSAMLIAPNGNYEAKVTAAQGYIANSLRVSSSVRSGIITIIEGSEDDVFSLGENTVTISAAYGSAQKVFIAPSTGRFTVTIDGSKAMSIEVNGNLILDSFEKTSGTFKAEEGDFVIIKVVASGANTGEFKFRIEEGSTGEAQYVIVGSGYGDIDNVIEDSCTLYFNVLEAATFTFQFPFRDMFGITITFTINDVDYVFDDSTSFMNDITFEAGEDIEIEVTVSAPGSYTFWVFPPSAN